MKDGWTALLYAAINGFCIIVELLAKNGANIDSYDNLKRNSLHWAARFNNTKMAKTLMDLKCDKTRVDIDKKTPIQIAYIYEN